MADQSKKEKGKGMVKDEEGSLPSLEKHLEVMMLQGRRKRI